jgi:hypothetical protein
MKEIIADSESNKVAISNAKISRQKFYVAILKTFDVAYIRQTAFNSGRFNCFATDHSFTKANAYGYETPSITETIQSILTHGGRVFEFDEFIPFLDCLASKSMGLDKRP